MFTNVMKILALVFLLLGFGYVWSSVRAMPQERPAPAADLSPEESADAKELFKGKCARCHGPDGRGQTVLGDMLDVPDFTNGKWWKDHSKPEALVKSITNGNGDMPAFGKKLTKPEIALLASYVRQFNKPDSRPVPKVLRDK